MRILLAVVASLSGAGCDAVFGLDRPGIDAGTVGDASDASDAVDAVDAPSDRDDDGVLDVVDNCPDASNVDQHDEDTDNVGDACDKCPHVTSLNTNVDGDTDGVGDVCDPNPLVATETLLVFDGFNGAALAPHWTVSGTAWTVTNGQVEVTATGVSRLFLPSSVVGSVRIAAELEVTSSTMGAGGVLYDYLNSGTICGFQDATTNLRGVFDFGPTGTLTAVSTDPGGASGTMYRYTVNTSAMMRTCTFELATRTDDGDTAPHVNKIGLAAKDATMRVKWFVAIVTPPP